MDDFKLLIMVNFMAETSRLFSQQVEISKNAITWSKFTAWTRNLLENIANRQPVSLSRRTTRSEPKLAFYGLFKCVVVVASWWFLSQQVGRSCVTTSWSFLCHNMLVVVTTSWSFLSQISWWLSPQVGRSCVTTSWWFLCHNKLVVVT